MFHDSKFLFYRFGAELDIFATQSHAIGSGYLWASVAPPQKNQGGTSLSMEQVRMHMMMGGRRDYHELGGGDVLHV